MLDEVPPPGSAAGFFNVTTVTGMLARESRPAARSVKTAAHKVHPARGKRLEHFALPYQAT
jgi:hypothetical protein